MEDVKVVKYDNGFELRYLSKPYYKTIASSLVIGVGAGYETPEEYGISHLIEHLAFDKHQERISKVGKLNGFTCVSDTSFDATFFPEKLDYSLKTLSEMVRNSPFNESFIERERKVISIERLEEEFDEDAKRTHIFYTGVFRVNPFSRASGLAILGLEENLRRFTRKEIISHFKRWYVPSNMVLYLVGNLPESIGDIVGKIFEKQNNSFKPFEYKKESSLTGRILIERPSLGDKSCVIMGWRVPPYSDTNKSAGIFLATSVLVGHEDYCSGLEKKLQNMGIIYSLKEEYDTQFNEGLYFFEAHCKPGREKEIEEITLDEIKKLQKTVARVKHFERERDRYKLEIASKFDDPKKTIELMKSEKDYSINISDELVRVEGITREEVQETAQHLSTEDYFILIEKPEEGLPKEIEIVEE